MCGGEGDPLLNIRWVEAGGPPAAPPKRSRGFFSLPDQARARALGSETGGSVELAFDPDGRAPSASRRRRPTPERAFPAGLFRSRDTHPTDFPLGSAPSLVPAGRFHAAFTARFRAWHRRRGGGVGGAGGGGLRRRRGADGAFLDAAFEQELAMEPERLAYLGRRQDPEMTG